MKYNPQIHHRRSIRLKGYDYSQAGACFITICCQDRKCRFGKIESDEMILNEFGIIAYNEWKKLPERFPNVELDVFQVMPNHMHGIVVLTDATNAVKTNGNVGAGLAPAHDNTSNIDVGVGLAPTQNNTLNDDMGEGANPTVKREGASPAVKRAGASPAPTVAVGNIIGAYKSLVANECLNIYKMKNKTMGKLWQRNFYEHIIRDERSYQTISNYIINNPSNWKDDKFFSE